MPGHRKPKGQHTYFYSSGWTKEQDNAFINMLAWQAERGYKKTNPNRTNMTAMEFAKGAVDHWSGREIPMHTYLKKLDVLRLRYQTFRQLLGDNSFRWNQASNRVSGTMVDWKRLRKVFAIIYSMCTLFSNKNCYERNLYDWKRLLKESLRAIFEKFEDGVEYEGDDSISTEVGEKEGNESEHESDVQFLGENLGKKPEVIDLTSNDEGDE